jgi:predicted enzyme related to lactoylglutathione lyase
MTTVRLQNIHVVARDVERVADFWQRAIGLSPKFRDADRWVQLKAGEQSFAVASLTEGIPGQAGAVPVFEVADFGATSAAILAHGGQVLSERDMGDHGRVLTFQDPAGNVGQLFARATGPGQ